MSDRAASRTGSNPFATRFVRPGALRYRFDACNDHQAYQQQVGAILDALRRGGSGLIVGPHGSGKSTLLRTLRPHLKSAFKAVHSVRLEAADGASRLSAIAPSRYRASVAEVLSKCVGGDLLIIDGAEQLGSWQLRRIARRVRRPGAAMLMTAHRPIPGFPVLYRTDPRPEIVLQLIQSLTSHASAGVKSATADQLAQLDWTGLHNVRDLWFELFDSVQHHVDPPPSDAVLCAAEGRSRRIPHEH